MKKQIFFVVCVLAVVPVFLALAAEKDRGVGGVTSVENADPERRTALVIGNGDYKVSPLKNSVNDARDMSETLKKLGFSVIHRENAGLREMDKAVSEFWQKLRGGGVGLFYYAGHGMQVEGNNYLIAVDAQIETETDVKYASLDAGKVLGKMKEAGNSLNIVILDACRNNPFARGYRSSPSGLAAMDAPRGSLIVFATDKNSVAADGDRRNGVFTESLLRHMTKPGLTIQDVIMNTRIDVSNATGGKQVPAEYSLLMGKFYFAGSSGYQEEEHEPPPVPPAEPEPGVLKVVLKPDVRGARVKINGSDYGEQREFSIKQKSTYTVEVSASGYETYRTEAEAGPGFAKTVTALLEKESASVPVSAPAPVSRTDRFTNSIGQDFVYIKPGTFMMGSPENEPGHKSNETQHRVTLTKGFYMQTTEVTQGQWKKIMGNNPSFFKECGDNCPVENMSWEDAQEFIKKLSRKEGKEYRLPTEAEWEYAARAGTQTAIYSGSMEILGNNNPPALDPIAWYGGNSCVTYKGGYDCSGWPDKQYQCGSCGPHPVGKKESNDFGLYDMIGNVREWCADWYRDYPAGSVTNPEGSSTGSPRVARGGGWASNAVNCRSASRGRNSPGNRYHDLGFRSVLSAGQQ